MAGQPLYALECHSWSYRRDRSEWIIYGVDIDGRKDDEVDADAYPASRPAIDYPVSPYGVFSLERV
jgi:hypothetical protein